MCRTLSAATVARFASQSKRRGPICRTRPRAARPDGMRCGLLLGPLVLGMAPLLLLVPSLRAAAPRVVRTVPEHGDLAVDPALDELRIEFDQDMRRDGYSLCGGGPAFPRLDGRPRWVSPRVLVVRVQLAPDHDYRLSINCPSYRNFRSATGEPAEIYPLAFHTRPAETTQPAVSPRLNRESFDALREMIRRDYAYIEVHRVDWDRAFARQREGLLSASSTGVFARRAAKLLAEAHDLHIWVESGGAQFATQRRAVMPNADFNLLRRIVTGFARHDRQVYSGRVDGDIGYVLIGSFSHGDGKWIDKALAALDALADAPALIIDVRFNSGGDELLARRIAARFVAKPTVYAASRRRLPGETVRFTPIIKRTLEPDRRHHDDRPVVVLCGPKNMSSCEAFLLMMKRAPHCTLVGQRSWGASGNPKPHRLPNGVVVYLPSWVALRPDGTCFETEGIEPDVVVVTKPEDFRTRDPVLERAVSVLRKQLSPDGRKP